MFDTNKKLSHNSWTAGGTHITNFSSKDLLRYGKAIELYDKQKPDHGLVISAFAYDRADKHLECYRSLHRLNQNVYRIDLSDFWRVYDTLTTEL